MLEFTFRSRRCTLTSEKFIPGLWDSELSLLMLRYSTDTNQSLKRDSHPARAAVVLMMRIALAGTWTTMQEGATYHDMVRMVRVRLPTQGTWIQLSCIQDMVKMEKREMVSITWAQLRIVSNY